MIPNTQTMFLVTQAAKRHDLDTALVCAVIEQESAWNTYAIRYEPEFFERYILPSVRDRKLSPTEGQARAFSWGLMQVMGEVAREFGFGGDLPELCQPVQGIEVGCKVMAHKVAVNQGNLRDALGAWNGGANPNYAAEVLARLPRYE